jgi:hypothetical protein
MEHYRDFDKPDNYEDQITWLRESGFKNVEIIMQKDHWIHMRAAKQ